MNYDVDKVLNKISSKQRRSLAGIALNYDYLIHQALNDPFVLVYKQSNNENLLQVNHMKTICRIYNEKIKTAPNFNKIISEEPHHLPNYIAIYNNKTSCNYITTNDVDRFAEVLKQCTQYYKKNRLKKCLTSTKEDCRKIINNTICTADLFSPSQYLPVILYNTFHYLADKNFVENPNYLKLTISVTPHQENPAIPHHEYLNVYKGLYNSVLQYLPRTKINDVQVVAYEISDLKFKLFQRELPLQSLFIITAIVLVVMSIWIYSSSLFVGVMTLSCITLAMVISYFVYSRIFNMEFFPFLNMLTLILIVGIGADDAFVYTAIWEEAKRIYVIGSRQDHSQYLTKWTIHALRHALLAMLVTSLTTAAAFYANIYSRITSVKCFGLYAGTSIIVNYLLMITLFPVVVILHDKHLAKCMHSCCPTVCQKRPLLYEDQSHDSKSLAKRIMSIIAHGSDRFFNIFLPKILLKSRFVWIFLLTILGIGMALVTFVKPGLNLPTSKDFQMFTISNALEHYTLIYKKEFRFPYNAESVRELNIFFGVNPVDNGYYFNPDDFGKLDLISGRVKVEKEQQWLLNFCQNLKNEPFFVYSESCRFTELLFDELTSPCVGANNQPGCCNQTIPMKPAKKFLKCFYKALSERKAVKDFHYHPVFDSSHKLRILPINIQTNFKRTEENQYNDRMYKELNRWFDKQKKTLREASMTDGWWFCDLSLYDLQRYLFKGTKESFGKYKK